VQVRINGRPPAYFLIDTGAGETILDTTFATQVGARIFGSDTSAFAAGQRAAVAHGVIDSMALGTLAVRQVPVRIQSTRAFALAAGGLRIDGILGTGLFMELRATLDYRRGALELRPRGAVRRPQSTAVVLPIALAADHLVLAWGAYGSTDSTLMLLDTGLVGATVVAPDTVFRSLGLSATAGTEVTGVGGGGPVTARLVTIPRVRLGRIERANVPAMMGVFPPALEHQYGFPIRGLISHDFLRRYAVTWDFEAMELVLRQ
jgi:predicted aspartyl protease